MRGLVFEEQAAIVPSAPNRADVACFVGFVRWRGDLEPPPPLPPPLPPPMREWLDSRGWLTPPYRRADRRASAARLLNVPVPIDAWETFNQLFAWESRPLDYERRTGVTYLGAAVRSFFAQGGRRCYVVSVGAPGVPRHRALQRTPRLKLLVPGYPLGVASSPVNPTTWCGIGHLLGLPDVSFLCLPDLPDIVSVESLPPAPAGPPRRTEERFTECSAEEEPPKEDHVGRLFRAPRCDEQGYETWGAVIELVTSFLERHRREVQLVTAVPMPVTGGEAEASFGSRIKEILNQRLCEPSTPLRPSGRRDRGSFVQLAYPWVTTPVSAALPERLETPDGVLAGVLARNALMRGTFLTAAGSQLADVYDIQPLLALEHLRAVDESRHYRLATALYQRVSILGRSPAGMQLLSDVTASLDETYRPASVHRLVSVIVRAARRIGDEMTFDASGETMWAVVRDRLNALLSALHQAGALRGASAADAFHVRCDRTSMTQADIDAGRVIADVRFAAAAPVEQIRVVLALDDAGHLAVAAATDGALEAA